MDRRQQKTQKAIREAFAELLREKKYTEITVQNILDRANIGRSTFYEHFKTKDELLQTVCSDFFSHVFCPSPKPEKHHDFSDTNDFRHMVTHLFYHFSEDKDEIEGILRSDGKETFMRELHLRLNEHVRDYIRKIDYYKTFPEDLSANHLITALTEITLWWINGDCKQSPEQIAEWYFMLIVPASEK